MDLSKADLPHVSPVIFLSTLSIARMSNWTKGRLMMHPFFCFCFANAVDTTTCFQTPEAWTVLLSLCTTKTPSICVDCTVRELGRFLM